MKQTLCGKYGAGVPGEAGGGLRGTLAACLHPRMGCPTSPAWAAYHPPVAVLADTTQHLPAVREAADREVEVSVAGATPTRLGDPAPT